MDECNLSPTEEYNDADNKKFAIILSHLLFDNLPKREGTEKDVLNLKEKLPKLKCNYVVFNDLTSGNIMNSVPKYVKLKLEEFDYRMDGLNFFILTHGSNENMLSAKNNCYNFYDFINKFNATAIPKMANKPKVFFVSACRGDDFQLKVAVRADSGSIVVDGALNPENVHRELYPNLLIVFGTYEGNYGIRHKSKGTQFIEHLCDRFQKFYDGNTTEVDILNIFLQTNKNLIQERPLVEDRKTGLVDERIQLAQVCSSLTEPYIFKK